MFVKTNGIDSPYHLYVLDGQWYYHKICRLCPTIRITGIFVKNRQIYLDHSKFYSMLHQYVHENESTTNILFGHSLAGAYALWDPDFDEYIIASPSRNHELIPFKLQGRNVFLTVSDQERAYSRIRTYNPYIFKNQNHRYTAIASILEYFNDK